MIIPRRSCRTRMRLRIVMNLLDFLFWRQRPVSYRRAIARARNRGVVRDDQLDIYRRAEAAIGGESAIEFGILPDGTPVSLANGAALSTPLAIGALGSGKRRLIVN